MVFRFRMLSDENDNFVRDYEVPYDMTLLDFHNFILRSLEYEECMASFFTADERWEKPVSYTHLKMALAPSMIEKAHAAGARILLCFGGQQEFLPLLENPDRIPRFVGYMVRLVEKNGYDGIDMDWRCV